MTERYQSLSTEILTLPMIPLRDIVLFPGMMTPFLVGREHSLRALEASLAADRRLFLAAQHSAGQLNPIIDEIHSIGTVGRVVESLRGPDGNTKVLIEGLERGRILESQFYDYFSVTVKLIARRTAPTPQGSRKVEELLTLLKRYARLFPNLFLESVLPQKNEDPGRLADLVASYLDLNVDQKHDLLETLNPLERLTRVIEILKSEIENWKTEKKIGTRVKKQMEKAQREYYLNEKMKAIQRELGQTEESVVQEEVESYRKKIEALKFSKETKEKAVSELRKLQMMPAMSAESTVSRNYLDCILSVPWSEKTKQNDDLRFAQKVLEEDHYGLEKIKERILEFLAVNKLTKTKGSGTILCFVGPPGVGKTSLASSIARATGRKFVRLSLGGVRDE
ncbi:MAG TPA: LON peptidase substrate-binding domain-containing protein, partial [Acidobacteriota bacterium]